MRFNPRARVGRDAGLRWQHKRAEGFNPRARVGRDSRGCLERHSARVSIHAPAWGATYIAIQRNCEDAVSIHAPAWGATYRRPPDHLEILVSIHAPAWGATLWALCDYQERLVSIHAPAWGATYRRRRWRPGYRCFNPRARVGRDGVSSGFWVSPSVSIHAPAWGATTGL